MPTSHSPSSPLIASRSSTMDNARIETLAPQQPRHSHDLISDECYAYHQHPSPRNGPSPIIDDTNEMLLDPHPSGFSPPSDSSSFNSGRSSVDHTVDNGAFFLEHPAPETNTVNDDYQSLLFAVSNIHMSPSEPCESHECPSPPGSVSQPLHGGEGCSLPDQELDHNGSNETQDIQEDTCSDPPSSLVENIYDIRHILVHNQRLLEGQIHQEYQGYHEDHQVPAVQRTAERPHETAAIGTTSGAVRAYVTGGQYVDSDMSATFDPRPTISSSYFPPTTESTIVLSSPPPGRSSAMFPYNQNTTLNRQPHDPLLNTTNRSSAPVQSGNGPYRPFVTGRDLTMRHQHRQDGRHAHQHSMDTFMDPDAIPPASSENDQAHEGGRVVADEGEGGHWSIYGSLEHHVRSFELSRYQDDLRQDVAQSTPLASFSLRSALAFPQPGTEPNRRDPHALNSALHPDNDMPIPPRYINPQPFVHPHYTSSTAAASSQRHLPYDISASTGNQIEPPRQSSQGSGSLSANPLRVIHESPHALSETLERGEAGRWTTPPSSSTRHSSDASRSNSLQGRRARSSVGRKEVVRMACRFCETIICERGMRAQLLADQSVALLSTDDDPQSVSLIGQDYMPTNCSCKIMDTACLVCGNAIGYHITQPCERCLCSDNNGHLWLFHPEYVLSAPRLDLKVDQPIRWSDLPELDQDYEALSLRKVYLTTPEGKLVLGDMVRREYDAICR